MKNPKQEEPTYPVSLVPKAATYDPRTKAYLPATSVELTWPQIVRVVLKKDARAAKDGWGLIPSQIRRHQHPKTGLYGKWRRKEGCVSTSLLILDVENYPMGGDGKEHVTAWVRSRFPGTKALIYTSWNHGSTATEDDGEPKWVPGEPRFRVIIPLATPVDSQGDWTLFYRWVIDHCDGAVDSSCKDPCRLSYLYRAKNPQAILDPFYVELEGSQLDPENLPGGESLERLRERQERQEELERADRQRRRLALERGHLSVTASHAQKYASAALKGAADDIGGATQGERHDTIYKKAFRLGTMVAADMINEGTVIDVLGSAARAALPSERHKEAVRTIQDAIWDARNEPFDTSELAQPTQEGIKQAVASLDWDDLLVDDVNGLVKLPTTTRGREGGAQ